MLIYSKHYRRFFSRKTKGFTLIELLVVSAIILLITGFILLRQDKFNSSTLLRSLSYSIALSVRQAQVYSTSVRETSKGSGFFNSGFGVYLSSTWGACSSAASLTCYSFFGDSNTPTPADGTWTSAAENVSLYSLGKGYLLGDFCAWNTNTAALNCLSSAGGAQITALTIFFRRPNPEPCIATSASGSCAAGAPATNYSDAYIVLKSTGNTDTRSIKVSSSGQISVCRINSVPPAC